MVAGNLHDISIGVQATKGSPATTPLVRAYTSGGGSIGPARETADVDETSANRLGGASFVSAVRVGGEPAFWARPELLGVLLWGAMGVKATTGASDPYTHTFTLGTTAPYLTAWRSLGAMLFERFVDCKISSLAFASSAGGLLGVTTGIVGLTPQSQAAANTTATPETVLPFTHMDAKSQLQSEGSPLANITAARVNIGTGATSIAGDAVTPTDVSEGRFDITVELEQLVVDMALWNRLHYGSATPSTGAGPTPNILQLGAGGLDLKWSKRDATGAVATPERSLQFTASTVQVVTIEGQDPNTGGDPLRRTVRYRIVDPGTGSALTAVLKNGRATYVAS